MSEQIVVRQTVNRVTVEQHVNSTSVSQTVNVVTIAGGAPGPRGLQGPQGIAGSGTFDLLAGVGGISALRVVVAEGGIARYPDISDPADAARVIGLAYTAAVAGATFTVQPDGIVNEPLWNWIPGVVWVGLNGALTQTPPDSPAWLMEAGRAVAATQLLLDFQKPIIR